MSEEGGKLIQFPGAPIDPENAPRRADGTLVRECYGLVHVYESVPGRCQCGQRMWEEIEGPRWPDDYRGFHTNVRPKKQK